MYASGAFSFPRTQPNKSLDASGGGVKTYPVATAPGSDFLVRRCLNEFALPRQLNRWAFPLMMNKLANICFSLVVALFFGGAAFGCPAGDDCPATEITINSFG